MREAFMFIQKGTPTYPEDMTLSENAHPRGSGAWRRR